MVETSVTEVQASPIRVLHLIDGLSWGGSQRWVWDIVRLSDPDRFRHHIVTVYPDSGDFVYAERLEAAGVYRNVVESSSLRLLRKAILHRLIRYQFISLRKVLSLAWLIGCHGSMLKRLSEAVYQFKPHVIHVHMFYGLTVGILVKWFINKPLIHSVPCLFSQMDDAGFAWMPGLYRRFHSKVDCFFTGASLEDLRAVGVPISKTVEIQGVVDLSAIAAVLRERDQHYREARRSLALNRDATIVLSVGRLHPSKGHLYALEAIPGLLKYFQDLHWVLLGEGDQRPVLELRAKELGIEKHVHLIGFYSDPLPFYAAADVYLRTTIFEAENLCSYQAMAMGLPVVGFDTGCETELLGKVGHGKLVPNKDPITLTKAIEEILLQPDKGRGLGRLGADYCRDHLDIQGAISAFCSMYARLARTKEGATIPD
ncbi:MAG: glycosyltransferase [Nitrospirota bacterium]|nr:glycosyltransferase [Nitrospirota bacterium]